MFLREALVVDPADDSTKTSRPPSINTPAPSKTRNAHRCPLTRLSAMPAVAFKTASRAVVRQTARIQRQNCQITKRHSSNKAADGSAREPHNKVHSDPVLASIPEAGTVPTVPTVPRFWHKLGPLSEPFKAFGRAQRTRPYATQFFTSLAISLFGDMGAQWIGGENYNPYRTLRALTTGAVASIPNYHW